MCHKRKQLHVNSPLVANDQQGAALMMVIMILAVLALLGFSMNKMFESAQESVIYEVVGQRTQRAAQSGLEIALNQVIGPNSGLAPDCSNVSLPASFGNAPGLNNCQASAACESFSVSGYLYFRISATGTCSTQGYVSGKTNQGSVNSQTLTLSRVLDVEAKVVE